MQNHFVIFGPKKAFSNSRRSLHKDFSHLETLQIKESLFTVYKNAIVLLRKVANREVFFNRLPDSTVVHDANGGILPPSSLHH